MSKVLHDITHGLHGLEFQYFVTLLGYGAGLIRSRNLSVTLLLFSPLGAAVALLVNALIFSLIV